MNFGYWTKEEIEKALIKIDSHYKAYEELKDECTKISTRLYQRYLVINENKKRFFKLLNRNVLSETEFHDRNYSANIKGTRSYRHNDDLKKYEVALHEHEINLFGALEHGYYKNELNSEIKKFKERLTYCTGGDISSDEIYLLCDMEALTISYEQALTKYRKILQDFE